MINPPKSTPQQTSDRLDNATEKILSWLENAVAREMSEAEKILFPQPAQYINDVFAIQGQFMEAKLQAFAVLGQAINDVFTLAGRTPPVDTRPFAEKLQDHGKVYTDAGVIDLPPPPAEPGLN